MWEVFITQGSAYLKMTEEVNYSKWIGESFFSGSTNQLLYRSFKINRKSLEQIEQSLFHCPWGGTRG